MPGVVVVNTTPYEGQKPGTSGLRKKVKVFLQENYTENFIQSILDANKEAIVGSTLVVGGDGRYLVKEVVNKIIKISAANGVDKLLIGQNGILSTPAVSHLIRKYKTLGGIVLTASHNPGGINNDFGIKFNCSNGGPAPDATTNDIYALTTQIKQYKIVSDLVCGIDKIGVQRFEVLKMWQQFITFLTYARIVVDHIIDFFFSLYWDKRRKTIPDLEKKHAILAESASSLAEKIRKKELKSEDLVIALIERIKQVNPIINAVAADRFKAALAEAKEVDALIAAGLSEDDAKKKPFLGVPFTTKESQPVKGMPLTLGLWTRRNEMSNEDSAAIIYLKQAGAIPIASTNLPELLVWQESRNPVYGMTKNPHHTGRSPGGSSGAEAALTASYATTISLCSDIGGSTRMPAFYCGMFGHHPTPGSNSCQGVLFRKEVTDSMLSLGFISKHAEDLGPLTKVISGPMADKLNLDRDVNIKDIKIYYTEAALDPLVSSIRPEMRNAMKRAVNKLAQEANSSDRAPQEYYHKGFNHMYRLWYYWMSKEPENYSDLVTNSMGEANAIVELIKKVLGQSKHCFYTVLRLLELKFIPPPEAEWAENITKDLKRDLFDKLGSNGVLLFPSSPYVTPYHYSCFLRPYNFSYFAAVNTLKCPATQVPFGRNDEGFPVGIQVLAAPYNDALCLTVAKYLEKEFGGAVMACKIKN